MKKHLSFPASWSGKFLGPIRFQWEASEGHFGNHGSAPRSDVSNVRSRSQTALCHAEQRAEGRLVAQAMFTSRGQANAERSKET